MSSVADAPDSMYSATSGHPLAWHRGDVIGLAKAAQWRHGTHAGTKIPRLAPDE